MTGVALPILPDQPWAADGRPVTCRSPEVDPEWSATHLPKTTRTPPSSEAHLPHLPSPKGLPRVGAGHKEKHGTMGRRRRRAGFDAQETTAAGEGVMRANLVARVTGWTVSVWIMELQMKRWRCYQHR